MMRIFKTHCHWTWRFRKIPILGRIYYQSPGSSSIHRRSLYQAYRCWIDWDVKHIKLWLKK